MSTRERRPTVVVVHEHAGALELIEAAVGDRDARVLGTLDPTEALELVRHIEIDVLVLSEARTGIVPAVRAVHPDLSLVVLDGEPMRLDAIADAVVAAAA
jgi:hypothetical protein